MQDFLERTAALRTFPQRPVREFLDFFEFVLTLFALVFVERHSITLTEEFLKLALILGSNSRWVNAPLFYLGHKHFS